MMRFFQVSSLGHANMSMMREVWVSSMREATTYFMSAESLYRSEPEHHCCMIQTTERRIYIEVDANDTANFFLTDHSYEFTRAAHLRSNARATRSIQSPTGADFAQTVRELLLFEK